MGYVIVLNGQIPLNDGCNYLKSLDKDGAHFTTELDDAIVISDKDRCIFLARGVLFYNSVDVYSIIEKTIRNYEYVW